MIIIATQCFPPDIGGIEILMGEFAHYLSNSGERVAVFADQAKASHHEEKLPYIIKRFGGLKPWRRWSKARAIKNLVNSDGDSNKFIVADSWKSLEQLRTHCPTLVLAHGNELLTEKNSHRSNRILKAFQKADLVLANSHYSAEMVANLGISKDHIRVFNPPASRQPGPDPKALAAISNVLDGRVPIISTVARLEARKGVDRVIEALPSLIVHYPNLLYVVGGTGPDWKRLKALAKEVGVENNVCFLGRIDAKTRSALFSRADVFVMPTRVEGKSIEGFGISYIDAAWFGVPSIASRAGGATDAVIDGVTGLVIDKTDVSDVSEALYKLLSNETLRLQLGHAAAKRAHCELIWSKQIFILKEYLNAADGLFKLRV